MNILTYSLPDTVSIHGREYLVNTDFRNMVLFELAIQDSDLSPQESFKIALDLFYTYDIPEDLEAALEALLWFYRCGKDPEEPEEKDEEEEGYEPEKRVYSYDEDAPYIYAAFKSQYGINLNQDDLHWWEFSALFKGLHEKEQIMKIIGWRSAKITSEMSKAERSYLLDMKKRYKLRDNRTQEEKEADFGKAMSDLF